MMLRQRSGVRRRWTRHTDGHLEGVSLLVRLHLYLIAWRKKRVEANNQLGMSFEQMTHSGYNTWGIYTLRLEFLHDIQKVIVHLCKGEDIVTIDKSQRCVVSSVG